MIVRRDVILLRMVPIRAIILHDRCILLLPMGADGYISHIKAVLGHPMGDDKFELRALEAILDSTCSSLNHVGGEGRGGSVGRRRVCVG